MSDSIFSDFVKDDSFCCFCIESNSLTEVPSNSLSFTIFIGSYPDIFCSFCELLELCNDFFLIFIDDIGRNKSIFYINSHLFFLQISDMSNRCFDGKIRSEILFYGLCFGRRLDYYEVFCHAFSVEKKSVQQKKSVDSNLYLFYNNPMKRTSEQ